MIENLPTLNAILNSTSALLLIAGRVFISNGNREAHKRCMIGAVSVSVLFLMSYLTYHYFHGSTPFTGQGFVRTVYFTILISHTILATAIVPLVIITLRRGLAAKYTLHAKIARWTFPLWIYVSVTGVIVYLMLYQM
jgi:uncharacterized membrane protein YozB (DUF420 family)